MALEAVKRNGFKENGKPWLPLRKAAHLFKVSKTKLTQWFNGRKTKKEAHEHERVLSFVEEAAPAEWVSEMGHHGIPLHASAVALHASVISGHQVGERWAQRFRT